MHGEHFDSTIPFGEPELLRASVFRDYLDQIDPVGAQAGGSLSRLSALSPSLQADLMRFEQDGSGSETIEVIAACLRHSKPVTVHLECADKVVPITVFPLERMLHCPVDVQGLLERHASHMLVMLVEPATLRLPDDQERLLVGDPGHYHPLNPVLWQLALRGSRRELLPEIVGPAVYRVSPAFELGALPTNGVLRSTIERLRRQTASIGEIASWPALDRERASRLLNALYLQSALMVSRSHPDAVRESWFGGL